MKKLISISVVAFLLIALFVPHIAAIEEREYTQASIKVDNYGTELLMNVFINDDDTVLVPVDILAFCGKLYKTSDSSDYIYYDGFTGIGYEKEILISKNGNYGRSVVYITPNDPVTISSTRFSDSYAHEEKLYLPLEELLPFLDAKVDITSEGVLRIYPNPVSIFDAIAFDDLESDLFSIEDVFAGKFVGATGYILDTIINLRFDRLDIIFNSGAIKDYSKLFEKLLTHNETYLSAFDAEKTPLDIYLDTWSDALSDYNDSVKIIDTSLKFVKLAYSDLFENNAEFAEELENFKELGTSIEAIYKTIKYFDVFNKQVDDHRNMLNAVYGGERYTNSAKCNAANETALKYGGETVGFLLSSVSSHLREAIVKEVSSSLSNSELLLPYKLSFGILKLCRPDMKETLENDSNMFYLDVIASDSSAVVKELMASKSFDEKTLEDLRLSMIMALITSKYAYEIYYSASVEYEQSGSSTDWTYYKINEWLTSLYLAADSVECCTPEYYTETKEELSKSVEYLELYDSTNPDTPDTPNTSDPSEGLEFTLNADGKSYSVTGIGTCTDTDVVIPGTYNGLPVTSIGNSAFYNCDSLTSVVIPDSVTSIGKSTFAYCSSLESIVIPDSVTSIGERAFYDCDNLTSVVIPDSVTRIGGYTFFNCTSLTSVVIPDSVTSIGSNTFDDCSSLTSVVIPDSVTSIGYNAFRGCSSLSSVVIPDSVTSIGDGAFSSCSNLTEIKVDSNNANYKDIDGNLYTKDGKTLVQYAIGKSDASFTIPNSVTSIGYRAFYNCANLTSVVIPDSVTSIGEWAFGDCSSLTSVVIPNSVTSIGDYAFYKCNGLTSVVIPDSVTSIGYDAFRWCSSLSSVVIPDSVTSIVSGAFNDCSSLTSVVIPDSVTSIGYAAFRGCSSLTSVVIPDSVTSIDEWAFGDCSSLTSVVIGDSVTSIGDYAFYNCTDITSVVISDSVTNIGWHAFEYCSSLTSIKYRGTESQWNDISKGSNWDEYYFNGVYYKINYTITYNYKGN